MIVRSSDAADAATPTPVPGWHVAWRAPLIGAMAGAGMGAAFGFGLLIVLTTIGSIEQLLAGVAAGDALDDFAVVPLAMGHALAFGGALGVLVGGGAGLVGATTALIWASTGRSLASSGARALLGATAIAAAALLVFLLIPEGHRPVQHLVLDDPVLDLGLSVFLLRVIPIALAVWGTPHAAGWVLRPWRDPPAAPA